MNKNKMFEDLGYKCVSETKNKVIFIKEVREGTHSISLSENTFSKHYFDDICGGVDAAGITLEELKVINEWFKKEDVTISNKRNVVAVSLKHSDGPCDLAFWGYKRTNDHDERCFGGYTDDIDKCELYSLEEFRNSYNDIYWVKTDDILPASYFFKQFECLKLEFDTVLVRLDDLRTAVCC